MLALTKYLCIAAVFGLAIAAPVPFESTIQSPGSETVSRDTTYASSAPNTHIITKRCLGKKCVEVVIINEAGVTDIEAAKAKRCAAYKCVEAVIISENRAVEVAERKVVTRGCLGTKCVEIIIVKEQGVVEDTE